jgi:hypothetical protein
MAKQPDFSKIWKARPEHVDAIVTFLIPILNETAVQPVSAPRVRETVSDTIKNGLVVAVGKPNEVEASLGIILDRFFYTDDFHHKICWYGVGKKWRGQGHAILLMRYLRHYCLLSQKMEKKNIPLLAESSILDDAKGTISIYSRHFDPIGVIFGMGLPDLPLMDITLGEKPSKAA